MNVDNYPGKAFYPSELYPDRVPIMAHDPLEAILSEADKLGMSVMMGVGMFAWFDFSAESLEWHKQVAKELWNKFIVFIFQKNVPETFIIRSRPMKCS